MKKIYHVFALLAALSIVSCVENEEFGGGEVNLSENGIAFRFNSVQTKSADLSTPIEAKTGVMLPLGKDNTGADLFLTETLTDLNALSPMTKGSPVYNENVLSLEGYGSIGATTYIKGQSTVHSAGNATFESIDEAGANGWLYAHEYLDSPWPKDMTQDLYFFLQLPAGDVGASDFVYGSSDGTIQFNYESPTTAAEQKDILFTSRTLNKKQYLEDYQSKGLGAPVYFDHVLTGVKFRSGSNNDNQTKTIITGVKFENLYSTGTCVVNPEATGDTPKVTWSDRGNKTDFTEDGFTNPDYVKADGADNSDGTVDYNEGEGDYTFGESWYAAGSTGRPFNTKNINLEDGSLTFWFIPQAIPADAKLTITFVIKTPDTVEGVPFEHEIDFGTLQAGVEWKAGQLRTYTLDPKEVDVTITDEMTANKKSNLHISNTGNVDEFVRMLVIGNWYDGDGNIVVGYQYPSKAAAVAAGHPEDPMVLPWYREGYPCFNGVYYISKDEAEAAGWDEETDGYDDPYGEFDSTFTLGSLGDRDGKKDDWADASGGYYYTMPIGPGAGVGENVQSATKDLFESYTVTSVPNIYVATVGDQRELAEGVHLVMEIVVQAIAVPADEDTWWLKAWYEATNIAKLDPDADRNAAYKALYIAGEYVKE